MVPSIIDVWGYDREFCSSSPPPSPSSTRVTQKCNSIILMKFCKNVDIRNPKRLVILTTLKKKQIAQSNTYGITCVNLTHTYGKSYVNETL